ncbi:unnamed protein product [Arctia plantaginis]|uniref:acid phosphatase n=1 Tax=Arctia plantaginis TaxID=874455 RepID=A0A8S0ZES9_ARCPL|nr:unnamed protein product [Arctia plantaginis]CAB3249800.1 unnamed protein product [Arctia plantaginis]
MWFVLVLAMLVGVEAVCGKDTSGCKVVEPSSEAKHIGLGDTELVLAFVMFRHGDRTPDDEELNLYPSEHHIPPNIFFPYGKKALTNKGKQRAYLTGKYLRQLYDGLVCRLYLPDQVKIRTTEYARTQMTALAALSGLYPPEPAQKWNPTLDWQPIPYSTTPFAEDDLMYWYNCPRYLSLKDQMYGKPEIKKWLDPYEGLFKYMTEHAGTNITTPEDVFNLDNLFQTLSNVGLDPPKWAQDVMPKIKDMTKIEYAVQYYNSELIKLASGVLMQFILNATDSVVENPEKRIEPKLYLISAHENNVAGLMAAARVFEAHQPKYGSTFSLELRKNLKTRRYGITAIYARDAGGPGTLLPINGCGGQPVCDYEQFVTLMQDVIWSKEEFYKACKTPL